MASSRTEIDILISMKILFVSKLESNMASKSSSFELKSYNVRLLGGSELHFFCINVLNFTNCNQTESMFAAFLGVNTSVVAVGTAAAAAS